MRCFSSCCCASGRGRGLRAQSVGIAGQDPGVQLVGLGQDAQGAGKIADPQGIDETDRELRLLEGGHQQELIAAGGLQEDEAGVKFLETLPQVRDVRFGVGRAELAFLRFQGGIQVLFRDVDAAADASVLRCHNGLSLPTL